MRITNTLHLGEFWISAALLKEAHRDPTQKIVERPVPPRFDRDGNFTDLSEEPADVDLDIR